MFRGVTSQPAVNAKVALVDIPTITATTGNDGRYTLLNVPPGAHWSSASTNLGTSNLSNVVVPVGGSMTADLMILTALPMPPLGEFPTILLVGGLIVAGLLFSFVIAVAVIARKARPNVGRSGSPRPQNDKAKLTESKVKVKHHESIPLQLPPLAEFIDRFGYRRIFSNMKGAARTWLGTR